METERIWISRGAIGALAALSVAAPVWAQDTSRLGESAVGNVVSDAIRTMTGADIALVAASTFRPGSDARSVSGADAVGMLSTGTDTVVVMNLTGKQLADALERSVSFAPKPFAGFLQVSGIEVRFSRKRSAGGRIVSLRKGGKPIDLAARYKVAMPRPLADGQLGYFQIWTKEQIAVDTGKSLADALAAAKSATAQAEGRITGTDD